MAVPQPTERKSLTSRATLEQLARRFGIRPSKDHSQNFMLDQQVLDGMEKAAGLGSESWVLEVGAGFGALTQTLLKTGANVLAFEIDEKLATVLVDEFRNEKKFQLVVGDFFRWYKEHTDDLTKHPFSIVANLPYNASSYFFQTVLSGQARPDQIIVLLQKEVAERIAAKPGSMSVLSLSVQLYGDPKVLRIVPKSAFWPQPDVDSAVLALKNMHDAPKNVDDILRFAKMAFANRRKQIHNSLAAGLRSETKALVPVFEKAGITPDQRPQELSVAQWEKLADALDSFLRKSEKR